MHELACAPLGLADDQLGVTAGLGAHLVGRMLRGDQRVAQSVLGRPHLGQLRLQLVNAVLEVGAVAPDGLVGGGGVDHDLVDLFAAVAEQAAPRPLVFEFYR